MKKLLMAAVVCSAVFFSGCKGTDSSDPKAVLISFFDALAKKDIDGARKLATPESKSMLDMIEMGSKMGGKEDEGKYDKGKMEFGDAKIDGDKATVSVKDKSSSETTNFNLKKISGAWKVAFDKSMMTDKINEGMDKMKDANVDSTITNGMDKLKNMNMDSLNDKVKEGLQKLEDATKKTDN
jgi:hypothetical protein